MTLEMLFPLEVIFLGLILVIYNLARSHKNFVFDNNPRTATARWVTLINGVSYLLCVWAYFTAHFPTFLASGDFAKYNIPYILDNATVFLIPICLATTIVGLLLNMVNGKRIPD